MRLNLTAIAAVAAGGLLLANHMRTRPLPHVAFSTRGSGPAVAVEERLVVRPMAPAALGTLAALAAGAWFAWTQLADTDDDSGMCTVSVSTDINVPLSTAYNQWTQFEEFPRFMASVLEVKQTDDTHLHWRALVAGKPEEWDAEITEQIPDKRIAWRSTGGVTNAGVVTFHKISDNRTRVMLQMDYQPRTLGEKIGDMLGGVKLTAKGNLKRFKQLVEGRGTETGAWRGTVPQR